MRGRGQMRPLALVAAVALAVAAAGCGREGELVESAETPPPTTTLTDPPTGTTPIATPPPAATTRTQRGTATTPAPKSTTTAKTATTPKSATTPAPAPGATDFTQLRTTAAAYARRKFGVRAPTNTIAIVRSRRKPRWTIASAAEGRTLWAVWLRDGAVALATQDPARFNPISVPCDVRPAFSEPSC